MKTSTVFAVLMMTSVVFAATQAGRVGETMKIISGGPSWPCSPSSFALPKLMDLRDAALDESAPDAVTDALFDAYTDRVIAARAPLLSGHDTVTIMAAAPGLRFVRVTFFHVRDMARYQAISSRGVGFVKGDRG